MSAVNRYINVVGVKIHWRRRWKIKNCLWLEVENSYLLRRSCHKFRVAFADCKSARMFWLAKGRAITFSYNCALSKRKRRIKFFQTATCMPQCHEEFGVLSHWIVNGQAKRATSR